MEMNTAFDLRKILAKKDYLQIVQGSICHQMIVGVN
jgi:hypothetical protein